MGMTIDNLCKSCINLGCEFQSGIVRTECAFYIPPYIEPDNCGNYVVMKPTVEAIPKDQYEARLKADLVAMLTELQSEIEEREQYYKDKFLEPSNAVHESAMSGRMFGCGDCKEIIQQKIDKLKEDT